MRALAGLAVLLAVCGAARASDATLTDPTNNKGYWQGYPLPVMSDPPQVPASKITKNSTVLAANTSTQIAPANSSRLALEIQCDGTATVNVDETGGTLTSPTVGGTAIIPSGSYPIYTPPATATSAITAYSGVSQTCRVTEYGR